MYKTFIPAESVDGKSHFVLNSALQQLIKNKEIKKFHRSNGWVDVNNDQRKHGSSRYSGHEMRVTSVLDQDIYLLTIKEQLDRGYPLELILGYGKRMQNVIYQIRQVANTDLSVSIQGETGTGKGVAALIIHELSKRRGKPFVVVDCSSITKTLVESELFGHERGSFTGAYKKKIGKFQLAEGGTIFLDEIGNLSIDMQTKLLQCLQDKVISAVGGIKPIELDIRVISATNVNLIEEVKKSNFREDLFYRLNEFEIYMPSLRERPDDIFFLAGKFLSMSNLELGKNVLGFSKEAADFLLEYTWPGNIREMKNFIKKASLFTDKIIGIEHFLCNIPAGETMLSLDSCLENAFIKGYSLNEIIIKIKREAEKRIIERVYEQSGRNKKKTSEILGIDYSTLYRKMKEYAK